MSVGGSRWVVGGGRGGGARKCLRSHLPPAAAHRPPRALFPARVQIPKHKVKLMVGAGGEKIKFIQKRTTCRIQVRLFEGSSLGGAGCDASRVRDEVRDET